MNRPKSPGDGFPEALADLVSRNTQETPPDLDTFLSSIDDSDYSLDDWIAALTGFDTWLTAQNNVKRPFNAMVGYVSCCTITNSAKIALPPLNTIVSQSLIKYGFDAGN